MTAHENVSTDLVPRSTIREMVAVWTECSRDLRDAFEKLVSVEERLGAAFSGTGRNFEFSLDRHDPAFSSYREPDRALSSLELRVWSALVDRLELRKMLSLAATARVLWNGGCSPPDHATIVGVQRLLHDPTQGFCDILPDNWVRPSPTAVVVATPSTLTLVGK